VTVERPNATVYCTNAKCLLSKSVGIKLCRRPTHYHDRNTLKLGPMLWSTEVFHVSSAAALIL
jgi:hypothetical protein